MTGFPLEFIPVKTGTGMTGENAGMTGENAGMTGENTGMTVKGRRRLLDGWITVCM